MNPSDPHQPIARVRAVTKTFGEGRTAVHALRGIDLDLHPGELVLLMGPSGCGKTTLVSILSGLLNPTAGQVEVFGVRWSDLSQDRCAARRSALIGYVFQQFRLLPQLTALENVSVPLLLQHRPHREAARRSASALGHVGLADRTHQLPRELSAGMQQRVSIARALVHQPRLLVCDEPTANLDAANGRIVMELLHQASRRLDEGGRPCCVLVVTHDTRIHAYADRIERMEDGRLLPPRPTPEPAPPTPQPRPSQLPVN